MHKGHRYGFLVFEVVHNGSWILAIHKSLWYDICLVIGSSLSQLLEWVSRISYQYVLGTY